MKTATILLGLLLVQDAPKLVFRKGDRQDYRVRFRTGYDTERAKRMYETSVEAEVSVEAGEVRDDGKAVVTITVRKLKAEFFDDNEQNENTPDAAWSSGDGKWTLRRGMTEDPRWPKLAGATLQGEVAPDGRFASPKGLEADAVGRLLRTVLGESSFLNAASAAGGSLTVQFCDAKSSVSVRLKEGRIAPVEINYGADGVVKEQKRTVAKLADAGHMEFAFSGKLSSEIKDGVLKGSRISVDAVAKEVTIYWRIEIDRQ